jgi:hypothetical protein
MNRQIILLSVTILIGVIGIFPGARDQGIRLPSCLKLLQMKAAVGAMSWSSQNFADQS